MLYFVVLDDYIIHVSNHKRNLDWNRPIKGVFQKGMILFGTGAHYAHIDPAYLKDELLSAAIVEYRKHFPSEPTICDGVQWGSFDSSWRPVEVINY